MQETSSPCQPGRIRIRGWRGLVLVCLSAVALRAHSALSSSAVVQLTDTRLEVVMDLGAEAAWLLLGESLDEAPDIDRAMERLKAQAPQVYLVSLRGKRIEPQEVSVEKREDGGVAFKLLYAGAGGAGVLRFEGVFLKRMVEGHLSTFTVVDARDDVLAAEILGVHRPAVEFTLPFAVEKAPPSKPAR